MRLKINKSAGLEELVRGCRKQNPKAQTELFNRFSGRFTGICRRYVGTVDQAEDIMISGFGKFCVKEKKQRRGRNPATGKDMMLEPRKVVTFRYSAKLKSKLNGKGVKPL